jgi:hypothetical protein
MYGHNNMNNNTTYAGRWWWWLGSGGTTRSAWTNFTSDAVQEADRVVNVSSEINQVAVWQRSDGIAQCRQGGGEVHEEAAGTVAIQRKCAGGNFTNFRKHRTNKS